MKYRTLLLTLATAACTAYAQKSGSNSPYSSYGPGLFNDRYGATAAATAGAAQGVRGGTEVNAKNPASYSALDSLTFIFDAGLSLQNGNLNENGRKVNARNTSIDYVTTGFRAARNLGVSIGLLPYSTVGYSMNRTATVQTDLGEVTETDTYSGDGGLHEAYLGLGWQPLRGFSIGVNGGYLWGDLTHSVVASFSDASASNRQRRYAPEIRSYKVDFGIHYVQQVGRRNTLTLGLTYGLGHKLGGSSYFSDIVGTAGTTGARGDTLSVRSPYGLPHTFGAGLMWQYGNRLRIGVDYSLQKWSDVQAPVVGTDAVGNLTYAAVTGQFKDMSRIAIGGEYAKRPDGYTKWRDKIRYRAGVAYTSPYTRINGADGPRSIMATAGVGIPIIMPNHSDRQIMLNLGAQYENIRPKGGGMITENYLRLCIGISFVETWFAKWKAR
ncbi:MAG: outer membrane protein transport protein [Alloprevotella sp.]|nr:outer membrane protein transport protein [Alloprevotella sp.]